MTVFGVILLRIFPHLDTFCAVKWTWIYYDETKDSVYCITCKNADHYNMLKDIRVGNAFIETGYSNWKHSKSTDKFFINMNLKLSQTSYSKTDKNFSRRCF